MEFTTALELHSQTTRLFEGAPLWLQLAHQGRGSHPLRRRVPTDLGADGAREALLQITTRTLHECELSKLGSPRFTRRY